MKSPTAFKLFGAFVGAVSLGVSEAANQDPIVLVHGLAAFPETWAYRPELEESGLETVAVEVGKFTSSWARACEAFAQLKGTVVDYGVCRSEEFGHARFGADYTGQALLDEWDEDHKVHLMGHSFGGPTIRRMERLLRDGSGCSRDTSEFLTGGHEWVTSLTSISGTIDGTTIVDYFDDTGITELLKTVILAVAGFFDNTFLDRLYTLDFAYWGLEREPGESFEDFWVKVEESGYLSKDNKDISVYDLSPAGAKEFNDAGPETYSDTYYFSFATERTSATRTCFFLICVGDWFQAPDSGMLVFLKPTANVMGSHEDPVLQPNDGLVNAYYQQCPTRNGRRRNCEEFDGSPEAGVWQYIEIDYLDHIQATFRDPFNDAFDYVESAQRLYREHGARLQDL